MLTVPDHAPPPVPLLDLAAVDPAPAGLPGCHACPYRVTGTPALCFACATAGAPVPAGPPCAWCGQEVVDGTCPNAVCSFPDREFSRIFTVSECPEQMWTAVCRYKYDEDKSWADLLGRILVGYLEEHRDELEAYDLITMGALYVGPQANRLWDHLRLVLDAAVAEGGGWPFVPDLITKAVPTGQFLGRGTARRQEVAEGELRAALAVPDPERVRGKRVLVVDDVYSEGFSLREMARALREAGAAEVAGVVFARRKGG
jgi:predicted amidophosphoribosyltransferase